MTDTFYLAEDVRAEILPCDAPVRGLYWFFDSVSIEVPPSHPSSAQLSKDTIGSSVDTDDEVRFCNRDALLKTAFFHLPGENGNWADWSEAFSSLHHTSGQLRLCVKSSFVLDRTDFRVFDPLGSILACVSSAVAAGEVSGLLEIERDFYVLVAGEKYCGWCLKNPLRYLCEHHRDPQLGGRKLKEPADFLAAATLVDRYLRCVDLDVGIAAEDQPETLGLMLDELEQQAEESDLHAARIIARNVRRTREFLRVPSQQGALQHSRSRAVVKSPFGSRLAPRSTNSSEVFYLTEGACAQVVLGVPTLKGLYWSGDCIVLNVPPLHPYQEHVLSEVVGGLPQDEFRFSCQSGLLLSATFHVPDNLGDWETWACALQSTEGLQGNVELMTSSTDPLPSAELRVSDPGGSVLAGVRSGLQPDSITRFYEIERDFLLLLSGNRYCGWCLRNPAQYASERYGEYRATGGEW